jgi:hypothetical protein
MRTRLTHCLVWAVFGVVTSVVLAIALAFLDAARTEDGVVRYGENPPSERYSYWGVSEDVRFGCTRLHSLWHSGGMGFGFRSGEVPEERVDSVMPRWATHSVPGSAATLPTGHEVSEVAVGWPFRCLTGGMMIKEVWIAESDSFNRELSIFTCVPLGPITIDGVTGYLGTVPVLPLRPLPAQLVGNAAIFATVGFLAVRVTLTLMGLRAHLRRRRGLCPRCAYRLVDGATCSECGHREVA